MPWWELQTEGTQWTNIRMHGWKLLAAGHFKYVFSFNTFCFRFSLNYFIVDNGNDFLCKGGNCDDQLTDVSSAFSSPFFSG